MSDKKDIFSKILKETKKRIGDENFAFGFSSVELISLENSTLVFGVPAEFIKGFIENSKKELQNAAKEIAGINNIDIIISDQKNASDFFPENILEITEKNAALPKTKTKSSKNDLELRRKEAKLNPNFTFKNFVVGDVIGDNNALAHSIAQAIVKNLGTVHNPCLFYGNPGLGKTHLLQAIGNEILDLYTDKKVMFYSSEEFLRSFVSGIKTNEINEWKKKTRKLDVLIIDDIQFLSGKTRLQEELYHLFNSLINDQKHMIFSSDQAINKIKDLDERLVSRFRSGMIADLQPPSPEMALGIIENALEKNKEKDTHSHKASYEINKDVINFIAEHLRFNVRDMLGFLERVVGYQNLTQKTVDEHLLRQWSPEYQPNKKNAQKKNTINNILAAVSDFYDTPVKDIIGKSRVRTLTEIRHIAMYLLKTMTKNSLTEIGKTFGVSHAAISGVIIKIDEECAVNHELVDTIEEIKEIIYRKGEK